MKSQADSDVSLRRLASAIALGAAVVLIVAKLWGWMATDSVALLTSAADAVVDALAAAATFFGVRFAQHPADLEHRFGHGKGEALAAFTQAILLAGTAAVLAAQSCWRLVYPQHLTAVTLGIWLSLIHILSLLPPGVSGAEPAVVVLLLERCAPCVPIDIGGVRVHGAGSS